LFLPLIEKPKTTDSIKRRKQMRYMKVNCAIALVILFAAACLAPGSIPVAGADNNNREPELPSPACDKIQVQPGHKMSFRTFAVGVQRYRWNGVSWDFVEPVATLYSDAGYHGKVGTHYAGPTWESNSGSKVVAARVDGCSPDSNAIPWLLLRAVSTEGPGIFSSVAFIHRVNTAGGTAPTAPGASIGAIIDVPYTAEYYFYRASN
jgi:hypothetical protein